MMDWKQAMEEERAALMRIVSLLLTLAGLAECAVSRSPAMRGFVLWILRRAHAVARDFVTGGKDARIASVPVEPVGARQVDAMRLAVSFRALARQLEHQVRLMIAACGASRAGTKPPWGLMPAMRDAANALSMLTAFAWPLPHPVSDTS